MNDTATAASPARRPAWVDDAFVVLAARRRLVVMVAIGLAVLGALVTLSAPSVLPPRFLVGAAVGLVSALVAIGVGLAVDAADLVVRGERHVVAAGGQVAAVVGRDPRDVDSVLAVVDEYALEGRVFVAVAPTSPAAGAPGARADALGETLARDGRRVLVIDLTRDATPAAGLSDVIAGERKLGAVARIEPQLQLARVPVGSDPAAALDRFPGWIAHLPRDLDVLVVALPPLVDPKALAAAKAVDALLVQVEVDRTERVDLIATLDAVEQAGLLAEIVLVDPSHPQASRDEPAGPDGGPLPPGKGAPAEDDVEPTGEIAVPATPSPQVSPAPDVTPDVTPPTRPDEDSAEATGRVAEPGRPRRPASPTEPAGEKIVRSAATRPAGVARPGALGDRDTGGIGDAEPAARQAARRTAALHLLARTIWGRNGGARGLG